MIAERVLGHSILAVLKAPMIAIPTAREKAHALKALAGLIENILRPEAPKVVWRCGGDTFQQCITLHHWVSGFARSAGGQLNITPRHGGFA